jgi:predicted phage terminase large subunit-like protein
MSILKELVGDIDAEKEKRISRAEKDFFFFARTYFSHLFSVEPAEYQRTIIDIINDGRLNKRHIGRLKRYIHERYANILAPSDRLEGIIDIEPRGHGKSTRMSIVFPLWRAITGKSRFVVIFSSSEQRAAQILDDIKFELAENEAVIEDFGDVRGKIWKANFIHLKNGSAIASRGAGASVRGMRFRQYRPDLVICDDIMKDDIARSKTQREKLYQWFKKVVLPLGKDIFVVVVNTIFHNDDLPSRLLKESVDGKLKGWLALRFSAIVSGHPLWHEYWSMESLEKKKQEMGSIAFSTEYMNEPLSEEDRLFKEDWLEFDAEEAELKEMRVFAGVDPALGSGDYSAIVTIAVDRDGIAHVVDAFAERLTPDAFMDRIIQKYIRYKPQLIAFEEVAFQKVMKEHLIKKAAQYGVYLPVKGVTPGRLSKEMRIAKISPMVENKLIRFRENQRLLIEQLLTFPRGDHDDLLDALYYAIQIIGGVSKEPMVFYMGVHRDTRAIFRGYR